MGAGLFSDTEPLRATLRRARRAVRVGRAVLVRLLAEAVFARAPHPGATLVPLAAVVGAIITDLALALALVLLRLLAPLAHAVAVGDALPAFRLTAKNHALRVALAVVVAEVPRPPVGRDVIEHDRATWDAGLDVDETPAPRANKERPNTIY